MVKKDIKMTTQTKLDEFFYNSHAVQIEDGTWYYHSEPVENKLSELYKRIAELEEELSCANKLLDNFDFVNTINGRELAIRDLGVQVDVLESLKDTFCKQITAPPNRNGNAIITINKKLKEIREQTKQLKENK